MEKMSLERRKQLVEKLSDIILSDSDDTDIVISVVGNSRIEYLSGNFLVIKKMLESTTSKVGNRLKTLSMDDYIKVSKKAIPNLYKLFAIEEMEKGE